MKTFLERYESLDFISEESLIMEADEAIARLRLALIRINQFALQELPPGDDQKRVIELASNAIKNAK